MISSLLTTIGLLLGGGSVWGVILKLLARFGLSGLLTTVTSGPIASAVAKLSEGVVDLTVWIAKGLLGWLGTQAKEVFEIVGKDLRIAVVIWLAAWGGSAYANWTSEPVADPPSSSTAQPKKTSVPAPKANPVRVSSKCQFPPVLDIFLCN